VKGGKRVKFVANDYKPNEICRMIREWTDLTQIEFGKTIHRSDRSIRMLESGESHLTVETLLAIAKAHNIKVIIEKEGNPQK